MSSSLSASTLLWSSSKTRSWTRSSWNATACLVGFSRTFTPLGLLLVESDLTGLPCRRAAHLQVVEGEEAAGTEAGGRAVGAATKGGSRGTVCTVSDWLCGIPGASPVFEALQAIRSPKALQLRVAT